ncbi:hypothetical protein GOBAR_DD19347 [Gossypium barbadense]|nr:hypothetical protein GOBAR_DD19347 [Gossypium barbadense]
MELPGAQRFKGTAANWVVAPHWRNKTAVTRVFPFLLFLRRKGASSFAVVLWDDDGGVIEALSGQRASVFEAHVVEAYDG